MDSGAGAGAAGTNPTTQYLHLEPETLSGIRSGNKGLLQCVLMRLMAAVYPPLSFRLLLRYLKVGHINALHHHLLPNSYYSNY